jgi:hypothetical protein
LLGDIAALRGNRRYVVPSGHVPNRTQPLRQRYADGADVSSPAITGARPAGRAGGTIGAVTATATWAGAWAGT